MFTSAEIRRLARSEEMFAQTHNFVGLGARLRGPIDPDALAAAFDALLVAHPVLAGRIEPLPDGGFRIVADDLMHPGIEILDDPGPGAALPPLLFDQAETLVQLRLVLGAEETAATLYVHHSLADGHHQFALIEELFGTYTDLVAPDGAGGRGSAPGTRSGAATPAPAAPPLEKVLADRGVTKLRRSGLERFMPAMFAYDLPPSRRAAAAQAPPFPTRVPMAAAVLDADATRALLTYGRTHRVSVNGLLSAAILIAEWRRRGATKIPVPYIYPVDLRYVLSPAVSATGCTNPVGVATYLAEIDGGTDVLTLARGIADAFRADLADGVIQQSLLHFTPQYVGNPPGLPDVVMLTDNGIVPPMRTPPDVRLTAVHGELYFRVGSGIDMYTSKIFDERLMIEYHTHGPDPDGAVAEVVAVLAGIPGVDG